ncbi:MAG: DUF4190 domain-containing protein [bacterium]
MSNLCQTCRHFQSETGVCKHLHFNVRDYPQKFVKKCNNEYYVHDPNKIVEENQEVEDIDQDLEGQVALRTVFIPNDEAERVAVVGLLESAGIPSYSKNAGVQHLFGVGQIGAGFNVVAGPVQIQVRQDDFDRACEVINEASPPAQEPVPEDAGDKCPACQSPIEGLPRCPECGLAMVAGPEPESLGQEVAERQFDDLQDAVMRLAKRSFALGIFWLAGIGSSFAIYYGVKSLSLIKEGRQELRGKGLAIAGILFGSVGVLAWLPFWLGLVANVM